MHSHLLEVLVDPVDGSPLTLSDGAGNGAGAIGSGQLLGASGHRYEIRDGVPRMVPSDGSSVGVDDGATQRSFGRKWDQYDEADRERLAAFQYRWFDERFGFAGDAELGAFLDGRRWILDAGTGPGLCAARCARLGEGRVVGMDLSSSVTAAQREYGGRSNLDYVQGDILNPPFAAGAFDLVVA